MYYCNQYENALNTVRETIKRYNMISAGDNIVVGVSGGVDSVLLLHFLMDLRDEMNFNISVAHVNHKIRVGDAERDQHFVEELCRKNNIPCKSLVINVHEEAKNRGLSEEEAGREIRYDFFRTLAGPHGKIATAHNLDDNVETVVMRFMRGTSITGLGGIPYVRGNIIRPILGIPKSEIRSIAAQSGIKFYEDYTNSENNYTRNKIRNILIPKIENDFNTNFKRTLSQNIDSYREDSQYLDELAEYELKKIFSGTEEKLSCSISDFNSLPMPIRRRVIVKVVKILSDDEQFELPCNVVRIIADIGNIANGGHVSLKDGFRVIKKNENIVFESFEKPNVNKNNETILKMTDIGKSVNLGSCVISIDEINSNDKIKNLPGCFYIPYDKYKEYCDESSLVVRTRKAGDRFRIDSSMHKKISDMMNYFKIPKDERDNELIMQMGNEIVWMLGYQGTRWTNRTGKFVRFLLKSNM